MRMCLSLSDDLSVLKSYGVKEEQKIYAEMYL